MSDEIIEYKPTELSDANRKTLLLCATVSVAMQREEINTTMGREVIPPLDSSKVKFWDGSRPESMVFIVLERGGSSDWSLRSTGVHHTKDDETTVYDKAGNIDHKAGLRLKGL